MPHVTRTVARYAETDQMGVVHHATYVVWFELGRTAYMADQGIPYSQLERDGVLLPVVDLGVRFRRVARFEDPIGIATRLTAVTGARLRFEYSIHRGDEPDPIADGFTVLGCVDRSGRPARLPAEVRAVCERLAEAPELAASRVEEPRAAERPTDAG